MNKKKKRKIKSKVKGTRFENEIVKKLREEYPGGFFGRNAGSHGFFDVWGITQDKYDPLLGYLDLIQAKSHKGKMPNSEDQKNWEQMKKMRIPKVLIVRLGFYMRGAKGHIIAWGEEK